MSPCYYIDTCSLQWRYLNGRPTATIDNLLDDENNRVFTAELTLLEWSSALARAYRRGDISRDIFKSNEIALMTDIYAGKLNILSPVTRTIEKARSLIEYVGVENKLNLGSGDAIHLISALYTANHLTGRLTFVTSNHPLASIMGKIEFIRQSLDLVYLDPK